MFDSSGCRTNVFQRDDFVCSHVVRRFFSRPLVPAARNSKYGRILMRTDANSLDITLQASVPVLSNTTGPRRRACHLENIAEYDLGGFRPRYGVKFWRFLSWLPDLSLFSRARDFSSDISLCVPLLVNMPGFTGHRFRIVPSRCPCPPTRRFTRGKKMGKPAKCRTFVAHLSRSRAY